MVNTKKALIIGGHVTPALAVMEELKSRRWTCVYVGRKHALEGDPAISQEYVLVTQKGYAFKFLISGRIQRKFTIRGLFSLLKIPLGFVMAIYLLLQEKPTVLVTFGGYLSIPFVIPAWILGIPIIVHEQTMIGGTANKFASKFAKKIGVGWKDVVYPFPLHKITVTGNPMRSDISKIIKNIDIDLQKPLLYVTGGNLGSHTINMLIEKIVPELLQDFSIIHQCGNSKDFNDYEKLLTLKKGLPENLMKRYMPIQFLGPEEIGWVYQKADILLSRAGANTVTEIVYFQKPTLFIPLPWSGSNEQYVNAHYLESHEAAMILEQKDASPEKLKKLLHMLYKSQNNIIQNLRNLYRSIPKNGAKNLANMIESVA